MNILRFFTIHKLISAVLCCTVLILAQSAAEAQETKVEISFLHPSDRLGFLQVTTTLENYMPPEREVIFILVPSGSGTLDAMAYKVLETFISGLNPSDSFNVLYPVKALGKTDSPFTRALDTPVENRASDWPDGVRQITGVRRVFPESVVSMNVSSESIQQAVSTTKKAVPVTSPQKIINLIESAVRRTSESRKPVIEIIVIFAPPKSGYDESIKIRGLLDGPLDIGALLDIEDLSRATAYSRTIPRISFLNYGPQSSLDKSLRRFAIGTNGFYIAGPNDILIKTGKAASLFKYDFLRHITVRLSNTDANFLHNDMWDIDRIPNILTLAARCTKPIGTTVTIEDFDGNVIHEMKVVEIPDENAEIPRNWAKFRTAEAQRNILTYGGDRFTFADLDYLKREWGVDYKAGQAGRETKYEQDFTKSSDRNGKSTGKAGEEEFEGEIPPYSPLAEIVPEDGVYILFPSVSTMFRCLDNVYSISGEITGAPDILPDVRLLEEKIKKQLAQDYRRKYVRMYDASVGEIAISSDDFLDPTNAQLTLFLELKHPILFRIRLAEYRSRFRSIYRDLTLRKLRYKGQKITALTGEMGEVSSYLTYIKIKDRKTRNVAILSNSLHSLKKAIDTAAGNLPSIAENKTFLHFRTDIPYYGQSKNQDSVFICISEALVERINSKRYRYVFKERKRCYNELQQLGDALVIFNREFPGREVQSIETLVQNKVLDEQAVPDSTEQYYYDDKAGAFVSRIFNRFEYINFIDDISESDLPMPSLVSKRGDLILDNISPVAAEFELRDNSLHFDVIISAQPKTGLHKMVKAILSKKPSKAMARKLDWHGYLLSFRTDLFTSRIRGFGISKEQVILNAVLFQLRRKLKAKLKWKGKNDVLGWVCNDIVIGFEEVRTDLQDFLYNSKGFLIIETRDSKDAELFLEALVKAFNNNGDESGPDYYLDEAAGVKAHVIDGFFFAALINKWVVISNDKDVFSNLAVRLASAGEEQPSGKTNFGIRLVIDKRDVIGKIHGKLIAEYGRWNATLFSYRFGNNPPALSAHTGKSPIEFSPHSKGTLFLDQDTGLVTSSSFGAEKAAALFAAQPYLPFDLDGLALDINGKLSENRIELTGSVEFQSHGIRQRVSLQVPRNLSALSRRLRRTTLSEFLVEIMDGADFWLSSIAEKRLSGLGRSAMRPLLKLYYSDGDLSKIRVLRVIRGMELEDVQKYLPRLYGKRASESDEVIKELYRTLVHFRHQGAVTDIYSHISAHTVKQWELEIVLDERITELAPALVRYIMAISDDIHGNRELRQWQAAEPVGTKTNLTLCIKALSEIGKKALPEILNNIPYADERQRALMALAILDMHDVTKEELTSLKEKYREKEIKEFLDEIFRNLD